MQHLNIWDLLPKNRNFQLTERKSSFWRMTNFFDETVLVPYRIASWNRRF